MFHTLRFMTVCTLAAMMLVQSVYAGWVIDCGCQTLKSPTCSMGNSSCFCCPATQDNSAKHCPHCQKPVDESPPPVVEQIACHCGNSSSLPTPPQFIPESSGSDDLNWMIGDLACITTAPHRRISLAYPQISLSEATIPDFKQVAYCVWLI